MLKYDDVKMLEIDDNNIDMIIAILDQLSDGGIVTVVVEIDDE